MGAQENCIIHIYNKIKRKEVFVFVFVMMNLKDNLATISTELFSDFPGRDGWAGPF